MSLSETAITWAAKRGISRRTLEAFSVASGTMSMRELGKTEVLCFPYLRGGDVVNTKYRALHAKAFSQREGGEQRFWNLDDVLRGAGEEAFIVEGEMDALALYEAGIAKDKILSVPGGAPASETQDPIAAQRYKFVVDALQEGLNNVSRFVLAMDGDAAGLALRHDLVAILGPARCWFVEWPEEAKDANDYLLKFNNLAELVGGASPWPIDGIYRMSEMPEPAPIAVWRPGFPEWESKIAFAPGMLSVLTGFPGHGKTLFGMQLWYNICREHNLRAAIASFETGAKPHHRRNLRQFHIGKPQYQLTDEEMSAADRWIEEHFLWVAHPQRRPSFEWFLDMAEAAVIRHGVKIVQIDPWNKLEADRPSSVRETDWIRDKLNEALNFAKDFNVHFQILAHPAKSMDISQRRNAPVLEDISGSRHWENIVDQGLSVYRPKIFDGKERKTGVSLHHLKARFEELGHPCKVEMEFNLATGRYRSADYKQGWEGV